MAIGKREPITFLQAQRVVESGGGGTDTWVPVMSEWAIVTPYRNTANMQDSQTMLSDAFYFKEIRQRQGWEPTKDMMIRHNGIDRVITQILPVTKKVPYTYDIIAGRSV